MIRLITQPPNSSICGQCCVAMITGLELSDVIKRLGDKGTRWSQLREFLYEQGIDCSTTLTRCKKLSDLSPTCIVRLYLNHTSASHWMIRHKDLVYDPSSMQPVPARFLPFNKRPKYRITSYAEINYGNDA